MAQAQALPLAQALPAHTRVAPVSSDLAGQLSHDNGPLRTRQPGVLIHKEGLSPTQAAAQAAVKVSEQQSVASVAAGQPGSAPSVPCSEAFLKILT